MGVDELKGRGLGVNDVVIVRVFLILFRVV